MKDPYQTLGVDDNATEEEIKQAFRDKVKEQHPDKGGSEEEFKETANAYAILKCPNKRKQYDETGSTEDVDPLANLMAELSQMFFRVIAESKENIEYVDIISKILSILANAISMASNAKVEKHREIERTEKLLNRITKKDGSDNFFEGIIKGRVKQLRHDMLSIHNQMERLEKMMDIVDMYECSSKEQEGHPFAGGRTWVTIGH